MAATRLTVTIDRPAGEVAIPTGSATDDRTVSWPAGEILRDIARGGLTGAVVGIAVAGIGARVVMRLAALLVPGANGFLTENGNRIGDITVVGSLALLAIGLGAGLVGGTIWVAVSPWVPGAGLRRAVLTMPIALAIGSRAVVDGGNSDFEILGHDPLVVTALLVLVALIGVMFALVDDLLDRRLPPATRGRGWATGAYGALAILGTVLILPMTLVGFFTTNDAFVVALGVALLGVGAATTRWWVLRLEGRPQPPATLVVAARSTLLAIVVIGIASAIPEVAAALGAA